MARSTSPKASHALAAALLLTATLASSGCTSSGASEQAPRRTLFQVSTLGALARGLYDGDLPVSELAERGDFGLGTFDRLEGEMIVLDGVIYQVPISGVPRLASSTTTTPFAAVTHFFADEVFVLDGAADYEDLRNQLDGHLSTANVPVAIKISGRFPELKVRSVPAQQVPFPPLSEAIEFQTVFDLADVRGTMVGFRTPEYLSDLNAAGHHFHFITDDRAAGGHVLDGNFGSVQVELQYLRDFDMWLPPASASFDSAELDPAKCDS